MFSLGSSCPFLVAEDQTQSSSHAKRTFTPRWLAISSQLTYCAFRVVLFALSLPQWLSLTSSTTNEEAGVGDEVRLFSKSEHDERNSFTEEKQAEVNSRLFALCMIWNQFSPPTYPLPMRRQQRDFSRRRVVPPYAPTFVFVRRV